MKIAYVITHSISVRTLLRGQLGWLSARGHEVLLICSPSPGFSVSAPVQFVPLKMVREISPLKDVLALLRLVRTLSQVKPDVVNASTPKAGLLGMVAATIARVPVRVYVLRGLRQETLVGPRARFVAAAEWLACRLAHEVVCVSRSLRQRALSADLLSPERCVVLASGSSNGVDTLRFSPLTSEQEVQELRRRLGLPIDGPIVGFVGRLTRDKGVEDLWHSFKRVVLRDVPNAQLLLVGEPEAGDPISPSLLAEVRSHPQVVMTRRFVPDTAPFYQAMSVLAFASSREGFPNAPLEASATGLPVVAYSATGTVDAVLDGVTGTIVPAGDWEALGRGIVRYLTDPRLARAHGAAGRDRAMSEYRPQRVWEELEAVYERLLNSHAEADSPARLRSI